MFETYLLYAISACLLAGQFVRIELFNRMVNGYGQEFFILLFILYSLLKYGLEPIKKLSSKKSIKTVGLLFLISFFWTISRYTFAQNLVAVLFPLRLVLYICFGVYLLNFVSKTKSRAIVDSIVYTFSILLLVGTAIQYFFFTNLWSLYTSGWDPHEFRTYFTFLDVYVAAALFGMLCFYWIKKRNWILSFLFLLSLILSFSRSAYVAFVVVAVFSYLLRKKWKTLFFLIALFVALVVLVPKPFGEGVNLLRTVSINSRIQDYKVALLLWEKQPILGHGYNRIHFVKEKMGLIKMDDASHAASSFHSSFLIVLTTGGLLGLGAFLYLLFDLMRKYKESVSIISFVLIMSLFDNVILHVLVLLPLIILMVDQKEAKA